MAATSTAYAENRLFPTDVLQQGELDAKASLTHSSQSSSASFDGTKYQSSFESTSESLQVRYGLADNWHIGAGLSHSSSSSSNSDGTTWRDNGVSNPVFFAGYSVIKDTTSPWSLSANLSVSPNTTGKFTSRYVGGLTAGFKQSDTLKLYGGLSTSQTEGSRYPDSTEINIGAFKNLSEKITLIPSAYLSRVDSTTGIIVAPRYTYGIGLTSNIEIKRNTYLIPNISFYGQSSAHSKDGLFRVDSNFDGVNFGVSLYHLF